MQKKLFVLYKRMFVFSLLVLFIAASCTNKQEQNTTTANTLGDTLLHADAVLHQRLQAVLNTDDTFAQLAMQAAPTAQLDAKSETIANAEITLQKTLDSLEQLPAAKTAPERWQRITGYFRSILKSRGALSDMRMVVSANSDDSTTMQRRFLKQHVAMLEQTKALLEKDKKIASLEHELGHFSSIGTHAENGAAEKLGNYAEAKGESVAELKQRNKNLYMAYSSLQNKYFIVGRNYLLLQQEHQRTLKEMDALRKPGK